MNYFCRWNEFDLKELWVISGQGRSTRGWAVPEHNFVTIMDPCVAVIMPAVHALSGCDTTSKVATKASAVHTAQKKRDVNNYGNDFISQF